MRSSYTDFDPFVEVKNRGIEVGYVELRGIHSIWIPTHNTIALGRERYPHQHRWALTHALAHVSIDLEGLPSEAEERAASRIAARLLGPPSALRTLLLVKGWSDAAAIAAELEVSPELLAVAIHLLRPEELAPMREAIAALVWPTLRFDGPACGTRAARNAGFRPAADTVASTPELIAAVA